jgi:undecaprenyl-diphosphatase
VTPGPTVARASFVSRLDARDRALLARWSAGSAASVVERRVWTVLTHLGGASCSILVALLPFLPGGTLGVLDAVGSKALVALVVSHLAVQAVKRTVGRPRPSRAVSCRALVEEPDRFSFPSGHAASAMSVAFLYGVAFPSLGAPLVALATLVGMSRVCLGVHYPGDVLVGQAIALATGVVLVAV